MAGKPGMQVGSLVAIQPDEDQLNLATRPLWLATVVTTATRVGVKAQWWESRDWNTHNMTLGPVNGGHIQTMSSASRSTMTCMRRSSARALDAAVGAGRPSPRAAGPT